MYAFSFLSRKRRRGFTLIELLLVLAIVTSLAALVVPRFAKRSEQAKVTAATADIASISVAIDAFEVDCQRFPASLAELLEQPMNADNWHGPYLKKGTPQDPWKSLYVYRQPGQHSNDYDLYSLGPDGQDASGDEIDNWTQK